MFRFSSESSTPLCACAQPPCQSPPSTLIAVKLRSSRDYKTKIQKLKKVRVVLVGCERKSVGRGLTSVFHSPACRPRKRRGIPRLTRGRFNTRPGVSRVERFWEPIFLLCHRGTRNRRLCVVAPPFGAVHVSLCSRPRKTVRTRWHFLRRREPPFDLFLAVECNRGSRSNGPREHHHERSLERETRQGYEQEGTTESRFACVSAN